VGRHRHVTCVRSDGLSAVLRPLLDDPRIVAATLVDVDSGLVLDGYSDDADLADLELLGAGHAEMVRTAGVLAGAGALPPDVELTVGLGDDRFHLLHAVPDPHGARLVLSVVVRGARRVGRARRRLRTVSVAALTAGPTLSRRPVDGVWTPSTPDPSGSGTPASEGAVPEGAMPEGAVPEGVASGDAWSRPASLPTGPAPPAAMPPRASGPVSAARPSPTVSAAAAWVPELPMIEAPATARRPS
jgi:hypothetical protein